MLFDSFLFALSNQQERGFWWNMGVNIFVPECNNKDTLVNLPFKKEGNNSILGRLQLET